MNKHTVCYTGIHFDASYMSRSWTVLLNRPRCYESSFQNDLQDTLSNFGLFVAEHPVCLRYVAETILRVHMRPEFKDAFVVRRYSCQQVLIDRMLITQPSTVRVVGESRRNEICPVWVTLILLYNWSLLLLLYKCTLYVYL